MPNGRGPRNSNADRERRTVTAGTRCYTSGAPKRQAPVARHCVLPRWQHERAPPDSWWSAELVVLAVAVVAVALGGRRTLVAVRCRVPALARATTTTISVVTGRRQIVMGQ